MPKQVIVIMQQNYPFGQCEEITSENTRVLVRKIYQVSVQERNRLLEKVGILRRLKNEHMIRIESVLEQQESVHFLFEYIPIKLETWISNINDQFIQNFRDQLIKFSAFLANNYIKIDFQLKNIGMDQNYGAKYFLDLDFTYDTGVNREKLKSMYIREITNLFKPYIVSNSNNYALDSQRERTPNNNERGGNQYRSAKEAPKNTPEPRKVNDTAISPPTNRANNSNNNNSKNKEKALAQYYQDVNMSVDSENEKILQEFMDVLDNQGEDEVKNPPQPPQMAKPQSQPAPQRNQAPQFAKNASQPPNSYQQQNSSFQYTSNYQQQQYSQQQPASSRQIQINNDFQQPAYNSQFHSQNNITNQQGGQGQNQAQIQTARMGNSNPPANNPNNNMSSQSMGRGKSEIKEPPQMEMWRESADLQNRVKNAIEKSMTVIKKFKAIKDNSQL